MTGFFVRCGKEAFAAVVASLPELVSEISSSGLVMLLIDSRPADYPNSCWGGR
jgi:hypothetical protein